MSQPLQGLYAITDPALIADHRLLPAAEAALRGGARLLQYRDKTASPEQRLLRASQLQALCRHHGALFLVNDDPQLAADIGALAVGSAALMALTVRVRIEWRPAALPTI